MEQTTERTWVDYYRTIATIAAELVGAAEYLDANPEYGTDERVAQAWREYAERLRSVERPT